MPKLGEMEVVLFHNRTSHVFLLNVMIIKHILPFTTKNIFFNDENVVHQ